MTQVATTAFSSPTDIHPPNIAAHLLSRSVDTETGCREWAGRKDPGGYGKIRVGGHDRGAHRVAYEAFRGPIPDGLQLDHLCRNRACINPDHLEPVTQAENVRRGEVGKWLRPGASETHCVRGHLWTEANTYHRPDGYRTCRACQRVYSERWLAKKAVSA